MISTLKSLSKNIRGVTAVEFAMILPLMLFMLFGVFQLGYIAYVQHRMETAVREAARLGITGNPGAFASRDALVTDYITKVMNTFPHLDTPSPSVVIQAAPTAGMTSALIART